MYVLLELFLPRCPPLSFNCCSFYFRNFSVVISNKLNHTDTHYRRWKKKLSVLRLKLRRRTNLRESTDLKEQRDEQFQLGCQVSVKQGGEWVPGFIWKRHTQFTVGQVGFKTCTDYRLFISWLQLCCTSCGKKYDRLCIIPKQICDSDVTISVQ